MKFCKPLSLALLIITLLAGAYYFQQHAQIIIAIIERMGWMGPVLFLIIYCLATILLFPTMVLTLAGGVLFGPILGTLFNLLGATLGAVCAFCISRHLARDWIINQQNVSIEKLIDGVDRRGWHFVALLRLIPVIPFNLINYGLGITRIKFSQYTLTTLIFLIPWEFIYTYCGYASMDMLISAQPLYKYSSLIILILLILIFFVIKRITLSKTKSMANS